MAEGRACFDRTAFLANYEGMEELARETATTFLEILPEMTRAIERAIERQSPSELEIAAHTLKSAVSNFFAEPAKQLALQLERLGQRRAMAGAEEVFSELRAELERLAKALAEV